MIRVQRIAKFHLLVSNYKAQFYTEMFLVNPVDFSLVFSTKTSNMSRYLLVYREKFRS